LILKDSTISNKHARIKKVKGAFYIYDIVSQRGTFVNGKKVLKPKPLSDFDEIRLGRTLLLFRGK
jgi:pSer/pThr/pTyr-binding forkhead associated (FHA) protein